MVPPDFLSQGQQSSTAHAGDASISRERTRIRASLKAARSALSEQVRWLKATQAADHLSQSSLFKRANKIALYIAVGAECPTLPVTVAAETAGKALHYPTLNPRLQDRMQFVKIDADTHWRTGRFHIPEPVPHRRGAFASLRHLDLVVIPLVGFDHCGNRLGMGAGFYDRSLAFRRLRRHWLKPFLLGLAYDCQQTGKIPCQPWDVPLDGVVTESGLTYFKHGE